MQVIGVVVVAIIVVLTALAVRSAIAMWIVGRRIAYSSFAGASQTASIQVHYRRTLLSLLSLASVLLAVGIGFVAADLGPAPDPVSELEQRVLNLEQELTVHVRPTLQAIERNTSRGPIVFAFDEGSRVALKTEVHEIAPFPTGQSCDGAFADELERDLTPLLERAEAHHDEDRLVWILVVGGHDERELEGAAERRFKNNWNLAQSRANCVESRLEGVLRNKGADKRRPPITALARGAEHLNASEDELEADRQSYVVFLLTGQDKPAASIR